MTAFKTKRQAERDNLQTKDSLTSNFSLHDLRNAFYGNLQSPGDNIRNYLQGQTGLTHVQSLGDLWRQFFIGKGVTNRVSLTDMAVDFFTNTGL